MTSNINKALPHFLLADIALDALVDDRIHPLKLPQQTELPAITFQEISLTGNQPHGEQLQMPRKRFQFTAYGILIATVDEILLALKARLDGYRGTMGTGSYITIVDGVLLKDERMIDDPLTGLYVRQQDYIIIIKE